MRKQVIKILNCILLITLLLSFTSKVNAGIIDTAENFISLGEGGSTFNTDVPTQGFMDIAGLLMGIGIFVAVAVGIILGIKFMLSTAEGKAEIKNLIAPFLIGTGIIVGALAIWKIAIEIMQF